MPRTRYHHNGHIQFPDMIDGRKLRQLAEYLQKRGIPGEWIITERIDTREPKGSIDRIVAERVEGIIYGPGGRSYDFTCPTLSRVNGGQAYSDLRFLRHTDGDVSPETSRFWNRVGKSITDYFEEK